MDEFSEDAVRSREDLAAYIRALHRAFVDHGHEWENGTLGPFLEALASWTEDADGWYRNFGQELPPGGDWTFLARALGAATVYE
ncbi:hypothetical protein AB0K43_20315 [Kitasatospora sp. NPDC049258]|uniref:DUF7660 family protein n=1 Tax=Kitasatospora sp. NPDC049258 TaxID=3155394 RepID=UPI00343C49A0